MEISRGELYELKTAHAAAAAAAATTSINIDALHFRPVMDILRVIETARSQTDVRAADPDCIVECEPIHGV